MLRWSCDRTCPLYERVDICRFSRLLHAIGVQGRVDSETIRVRVDYRDHEALARAVAALGGRVLGQGTHRLFAGAETGVGMELPGWQYPLVLRADGTLAFDHHGGRWGRPSDLERLAAEYAAAAAMAAAADQGWYAERQSDGSVLVYHPAGGTLTISASGGVHAAGFVGQGCHAPTELLAAAVGRPVESAHTADYYASHARVRAGGAS